MRYLATVIGIVPAPVDGVPSPAIPEPCATVLLDFHAPAAEGLGKGDEVDVTVRVRVTSVLPG
jgi:hypothetical protein